MSGFAVSVWGVGGVNSVKINININTNMYTQKYIAALLIAY